MNEAESRRASKEGAWDGFCWILLLVMSRMHVKMAEDIGVLFFGGSLRVVYTTRGQREEGITLKKGFYLERREKNKKQAACIIAGGIKGDVEAAGKRPSAV